MKSKFINLFSVDANEFPFDIPFPNNRNEKEEQNRDDKQ